MDMVFERPADMYVEILNPFKQEVIVQKVFIRPFTKELLNFVNKDFEVAIFTAAQENYANLVIDAIDPERKLV